MVIKENVFLRKHMHISLVVWGHDTCHIHFTLLDLSFHISERRIIEPFSQVCYCVQWYNIHGASTH